MEEKAPLVSVILTCYNQEAYIGEAIDSVLRQTYDHWECMIVNDGSCDGSEQVIMDYAGRDSRLVYISQENQGVVAARNRGIRQSKGKYILPLDGDDVIEPEYLALAVEVMERQNDVAIVCCDVEMFGKEQGPLVLQECNLHNILLYGCCVSSSMFRRSGFDHVGGFKEEMAKGWEDWEFFISLLETGGRAYKLNKSLFRYRIIENSRDRKIDEKVRVELLSKIVRLHPYLYYKEYGSLWQELKFLKRMPGFSLFWKFWVLVYKIRHHGKMPDFTFRS